MMERLFEFNSYTDNFSQEVLDLIKRDYNYWEETSLMEFSINHKYLHYDRQHNEFWTSDYFNRREKKFSVEDIHKQRGNVMITTAPEEQSILEELISIHHQAYLVTLEYPESEDARMVVDTLGRVIVRVEGIDE